MGISEKIKAINHKIEENEAQYDLDRQTVTISALSSVNVSKKMNFELAKMFYPRKTYWNACWNWQKIFWRFNMWKT